MEGWAPSPFLIAHRGASGVAPENTMVAFERALELGAAVLECDVQLSADDVPVVIHDPRVDRTTDGRGLVRRLSWSELGRLDAGYPRRFGADHAGQRLPRLEDILDLARGAARVMVEIKPESVDGDGVVEDRVVEAARTTAMLDDVGVLSFSRRALEGVAARAPGMPRGLVFRWWRQRGLVADCAAAGAGFLVAYAARLAAQPDTIARARGAGLGVGAYVVDEPETMERLVAAGVDGIATNRIDLLAPRLAGAAARPDAADGRPDAAAGRRPGGDRR